MTDTLNIALNKLTPWKGNVRRTGAKDGIGELAASIAAHGLLQSLVVRKARNGKYEILAGRRRYLALQSLAKAGTLSKDHPVPCTLASDAVDASELSLAENIVRMPMHPADQFEAFRTVIDDTGASVADVAARFGVPESVVAKRLRLGRLSPIILDAYRQGRIDLEDAQAFAITDDREAQERVFNDLPEWRLNPRSIRQALTESEIPVTDKRVRFAGLDAYEAAGGAIRRDLFDEDNAGYVQDAELLDRLVADKLRDVATTVSGEGWAFVETVCDLDHEALATFTRVWPEQAELSEAEQAERDRLAAEYDELAESGDDDAAERLVEIQERIDQLNAVAEVWPAETLAIAGAMVGLTYDGSVRIERGLVRHSDAKALRKTDAKTPSAANAMPASLVEDLTAQRSAAIGAELIRQPDIALAAVVHALALPVLYDRHGEGNCLELSESAPRLSRWIKTPEPCMGLLALDAERARLADLLPGDPAALWHWCLEQSRETLLTVLAFVAGSTVNAVRTKCDRPDCERLTHAHALSHALALDMSAWFTPTAAGFFARIGRTAILHAIDEAKGSHAPTLAKLKKAELAARAESIVSGTGWLPEPLRQARPEAE